MHAARRSAENNYSPLSPSDVNKYSLPAVWQCGMCLSGGTLACYVAKLVAVIAADFVLAATTAADSPRAVARPVISFAASI